MLQNEINVVIVGGIVQNSENQHDNTILKFAKILSEFYGPSQITEVNGYTQIKVSTNHKNNQLV